MEIRAYPYRAIRGRFLPRLIKALELQAIDSAAPVLTAYHVLGEWLADTRTARRPAEEVPLEVITPSLALSLRYGIVVRCGGGDRNNDPQPGPPAGNRDVAARQG